METVDVYVYGVSCVYDLPYEGIGKDNRHGIHAPSIVDSEIEVNDE